MAKLYFRYGAMGAAKTLNLLAVAHNYRAQGKTPFLIKPSVDTRMPGATIGSRAGLSVEADLVVDPFMNLYRVRRNWRGVACVLVDEAQFLTRDHVLQLCRVSDELGIPVLCYGLRTDFRGELFEGSAALLALADALVELKAVCECGRKATMNLRVDAEGHAVASGAQTEIGGNDRYVALCRRHFFERLRES